MGTFFDLLICLFLVITALPAVILLYSRTKRKHSWEYAHKTITLVISIILLTSTLILVYGSFIEPRLLITKRYEIDLAKINQPITIVFIADFQVGKYKQTAWVEKVVKRILILKPDLVLIGGDQVDNESLNLKELSYLEPLEKLAKQIPTYAIPGNHEYGVSCFWGIATKCAHSGDINFETKQALENLNIKYLSNDLEKITLQEQSFYLFGGDSYWAQKLNYTNLDKRQEDLATLALIHNPLATYQATKKDIDLILSGHTHGGQVRLPFLGPVARVDSLIPAQWYQGLQQYEDTQLLVTSGVGETGTRARLFNPPEIILLTIK